MNVRLLRLFPAALLGCGILASSAASAEKNAAKVDPRATAGKVDRLLNAGFAKAKITPAPVTTDDDFLRRVTLDLTGKTPSVRDVTLFGLDPSKTKRANAVERLLASDAFAQNWAWYWRDVVMTRATDQRARLAQSTFDKWLTEQFKANTGWDEIVTRMLTATGDVREKGEAALIFAHNGDAKEIAAETSRIFLGIQIQCANCHDHPTDKWKREQFHQLAAFFPRMRVAPIRDPERNRIRSYEVVSAEYGRRARTLNAQRLLRDYDKNKDGKITKAEVKGSFFERGFTFLLRRGDRNKDDAISKAELQRLVELSKRFRRNRPGTEYYMPDLQAPSSRGKKMDPVFFVGEQKIHAGLNDIPRREELARLLTSTDNKWFARAFVNRIWGEMLGEGFYMPIDDLGPQRNARFPEALDLLADGFAKTGYDVKWLFRTIANSKAYQRQIRPRNPQGPGVPFASAHPTRLRSDQVYNAILETLGVKQLNRSRFNRRRRGGQYRRFAGERFAFSLLFGFDPSTPQEDVLGTVPQALFLMNSPTLNSYIRGYGNTRLAKILRENRDNDAALSELYLMVHAREPSKKERAICNKYIAKVSNRTEAFEDILWSLLNSSEFLTKR